MKIPKKYRTQLLNSQTGLMNSAGAAELNLILNRSNNADVLPPSTPVLSVNAAGTTVTMTWTASTDA